MTALETEIKLALEELSRMADENTRDVYQLTRRMRGVADRLRAAYAAHKAALSNDPLLPSSVPTPSHSSSAAPTTRYATKRQAKKP
jgi:hypothetical protein